LHNNSFWEFVILNRESETSSTDKEKETVPLSAYEEELETIFFSLKTSDAVVSTIESNLDDSGDEDEDDDLLEDAADSENMEEPIKTEEECRAALNKLSTVKKYQISQMALQDLDVVGHAMLGPDLKAKRLEQRDKRKERIAQIHEAVEHFQSEARTRRQNLQDLQATSAGDEDTVSECSWEVECADILPND
jgi:hypothetical protein